MKGIDFNLGSGITFSKHIPEEKDNFDRVFEIFKELITHTSGDIEESFNWLESLDKEYNIFSEEYSLEDFQEDLKKRGYIKDEIDSNNDSGSGNSNKILTAKLESALRKYALDQIFGKIKKSGLGNHQTSKSGLGDEKDGELREFRYGDDISSINMTESVKKAQINNGLSDFLITENDLVVEQTQHKAQMSTVLMIDISHSMILYGEDRITPAKKVAMALVELIKRKYPKDSIDIIVFGNEAWNKLKNYHRHMNYNADNNYGVSI